MQTATQASPRARKPARPTTIPTVPHVLEIQAGVAWKVQSSSHPAICHTVRLTAEGLVCSCPARVQNCRHIKQIREFVCLSAVGIEADMFDFDENDDEFDPFRRPTEPLRLARTPQPVPMIIDPDDDPGPLAPLMAQGSRRALNACGALQDYWKDFHDAEESRRGFGRGRAA